MNTFDILIRPVEESDINELSELAKRTWVATFGSVSTENTIQQELEEFRSVKYFKKVFQKDIILLAFVDSKMAGYVQFGQVESKNIKPTGAGKQLRRLYVDSSLQGRGLGKKLLEAALAHPLMQGADNIYLDVWDKNQKAINLYTKYGFKVTEKIPYISHNKATGFDYIMVRPATI